MTEWEKTSVDIYLSRTHSEYKKEIIDTPIGKMNERFDHQTPH